MSKRKLFSEATKVKVAILYYQSRIFCSSSSNFSTWCWALKNKQETHRACFNPTLARVFEDGIFCCKHSNVLKY
jgi:hypothetical protein